jgi:hypothetical protein
MKYLKLGPKATIFFDPTTQILIRGTEVIAAKAFKTSKKLALALNQGHISWATEEEYNASKEEGVKGKEIAKPVNRLTDDGKDELYDLSPEDFKKMVKDSGFSAADQKAIMKAEDKVVAYREIELTYE